MQMNVEWNYFLNPHGKVIPIKFEPGFVYEVHCVLGPESILRATTKYSEDETFTLFSLSNQTSAESLCSQKFTIPTDFFNQGYTLFYSGTIKGEPGFTIAGTAPNLRHILDA